MIASTHLTFSWTIFFVFLAAMGIATNTWTITAISIGAILPDIDTPSSIVGKMFPWISRRIERRWGHRTITHSWLTLLGITALLTGFSCAADNVIPAEAGIQTSCMHISTSFCVGLWTHSILDTFTVQGLKVLFPLSNKRGVFPFDVQFPHSFRTVTGSRFDKILTLIFLLTSILTLPLATVGYQRLIRFIHKDMSSAMNDYHEFVKDFTVNAEIIAVNTTTRQTLTGTFPIVGATGEKTLIIEREGAFYTVGDASTDNFIVEKIVCHKADRMSVVTRYVDLSHQLLKNVEWFVPPGASRILLFGELNVSNQPTVPHYFDQFNSITTSSNRINLEFGTIAEIYRLKLEDCLILSGTVMIKAILPDSISRLQIAGDMGSTIATQDIVPISIRCKNRPRILVSIGDTVAPYQSLADQRDSLKDGIDVSDDRLLQLQLSAMKAKYEEESRVSKEFSEMWVADSLAAYKNYMQNKELNRVGYTSIAHVDRSHKDLLAIRAKLTRALADKEVLRKAYEAEVQAKVNAISNLKWKQLSSANYLKSPYRARIHDIRYTIERDQSTTVTILLSVLK